MITFFHPCTVDLKPNILTVNKEKCHGCVCVCVRAVRENMDGLHLKMAAHGEATRTDLLLSNSRSHSTRLLFTGEDKVQSINAKQVLSLAHCV